MRRSLNSCSAGATVELTLAPSLLVNTTGVFSLSRFTVASLLGRGPGFSLSEEVSPLVSSCLVAAMLESHTPRLFTEKKFAPQK